jgi:hypothetical protein
MFKVKHFKEKARWLVGGPVYSKFTLFKNLRDIFRRS